MKIRTIIAYAIFSILTIPLLINKINWYFESQVPDYITLTHKLMHESSKKMAAKHDMKVMGFGGEMMQCVVKVSLSFDVERVLDKDEARAIILDVIEDLAKTINSNKQIRPDLIEFPFPESHLKISIFVNSQKTKHLQSYLDIISFHHEKIVYMTAEGQFPNKQYSEESEHLSEAKQLVRLK